MELQLLSTSIHDLKIVIQIDILRNLGSDDCYSRKLISKPFFIIIISVFALEIFLNYFISFY